MVADIETFTVNHSDEDYPINYRLFDDDNAWTNKDQGPGKLMPIIMLEKSMIIIKMSTIVIVLMGKVKRFAPACELWS